MIAASETEEVKRYLPSKRELTPKVNHTKTMITKSAPFLITKHHLDDTQMKRALHYEDSTVKDNRNRRYSYKGEVISVQNSKINTKINSQPQTPSQKLHLKSTNTQFNDYYHKKNLEEVAQKVPTQEDNHKKQQMPYFKKSGVRETRSNSNIINREHQINRREGNSQKKGYLMVKECQEYGLEQIHAARKKMQKQAKKLRKLHQQRFEKDNSQMEQSKIANLQDEIKKLKIKTLQSEKQRYKSELQQRLRLQQQTKQKITQSQAMKINRAKLILNKPKYKAKQTNDDDTDSQFSSLQLN